MSVMAVCKADLAGVVAVFSRHDVEGQEVVVEGSGAHPGVCKAFEFHCCGCAPVTVAGSPLSFIPTLSMSVGKLL